MEILEITMNHFGKFTNQTMRFHPGINIIYGDNETGKSTMRAFIRGMLFGIEKMRGRAAACDEYSIRRPWENGNYFSGSLRFQCCGKIYRVERSFEQKEKELRLICETDGSEAPDAQEALARLLGGLDEAAFSNTVLFERESGQTDGGLADAVRNGMINAGQTGAGNIDAAGAMEELKEERKRLEREKKQKMAEKIERLQEISMKIDYVTQEASDLEKQEQKLRERLREMDADEAQWQGSQEMEREESESLPQTVSIWKIGKIIMAVFAVAALAAGLLYTQAQVRIGAAAVILLACLGVGFFGARDEKQKEAKREQERILKEQRMQKAYARQRRQLQREQAEAPKRQRLTANLEWAVNTRKEKQNLLSELQEQYDNLRDDREAEEEMEKKLLAIYLAIDTLTEVTAEIHREYARELNERMSEILAQITGGKYTRVFLDENFQVRISTPQKLLSIWQVSRGTMEQVYFALRMACAGFLNPRERLPLILDDAFVTYDDTRLEQTLKWLSADGRQVLLFTCHRREQEIMQKLYQ